MSANSRFVTDISRETPECSSLEKPLVVAREYLPEVTFTSPVPTSVAETVDDVPLQDEVVDTVPEAEVCRDLHAGMV